MNARPVIVVFDVGKTNKKIFLFNENYKIVFERSARFIETYDEDGDPCENLESLRLSIFESLSEVLKRGEFKIKAINFSSYGASLVYINENGQPLSPLYNYLKAYPAALQNELYAQYGGKEAIAVATASPVLGSLNSGMQLYRIKKHKSVLYKQIKYALHLPQYLSFLLSGVVRSDLTSLGCHTQLWDFAKNDYHNWVKKEELVQKLAPLAKVGEVFPVIIPIPGYSAGSGLKVGAGLHDSSAALIPYLINFHEPFVLISTGTWSISFNPFNFSPLTVEELEQDCLCYLGYQGKPVKASRIFAGHDHDQQVKRIARYFNQDVNRYRRMPYNEVIIEDLLEEMEDQQADLKTPAFVNRALSSFPTDEYAYHQLMLDIARQQQVSTQLVLINSDVNRVFVDGGFSKNAIYMNLLARLFPELEVFAASMAQATAIGAALAIHSSWNTKSIPNDLIDLKYYGANVKF